MNNVLDWSEETIRRDLAKLAKDGLVEQNGDNYRLTPEGIKYVENLIKKNSPPTTAKE